MAKLEFLKELLGKPVPENNNCVIFRALLDRERVNIWVQGKAHYLYEGIAQDTVDLYEIVFSLPLGKNTRVYEMGSDLYYPDVDILLTSGRNPHFDITNEDVYAKIFVENDGGVVYYGSQHTHIYRARLFKVFEEDGDFLVEEYESLREPEEIPAWKEVRIFKGDLVSLLSFIPEGLQFLREPKK